MSTQVAHRRRISRPIIRPKRPSTQPPRRIDLLTDVSGLDFDEAWNNRTVHSIGARSVPFLGREDLIRKRATGRPKDVADLGILEDE